MILKCIMILKINSTHKVAEVELPCTAFVIHLSEQSNLEEKMDSCL